MTRYDDYFYDENNEDENEDGNYEEEHSDNDKLRALVFEVQLLITLSTFSHLIGVHRE